MTNKPKIGVGLVWELESVKDATDKDIIDIYNIYNLLSAVQMIALRIINPTEKCERYRI